jgi:hypothetical protein
MLKTKPMKTNQSFGQAVEAMKQGKIVSREGWNGKGMFVFMQVPSEVPAEIISKMTSLPAAVKARVIERGQPLRYQNQLAIVYPDNNIYGWLASPSDCLETDWCIHEQHLIASETVGVAKHI